MKSHVTLTKTLIFAVALSFAGQSTVFALPGFKIRRAKPVEVQAREAVAPGSIKYQRAPVLGNQLYRKNVMGEDGKWVGSLSKPAKVAAYTTAAVVGSVAVPLAIGAGGALTMAAIEGAKVAVPAAISAVPAVVGAGANVASAGASVVGSVVGAKITVGHVLAGAAGVYVVKKILDHNPIKMDTVRSAGDKLHSAKTVVVDKSRRVAGAMNPMRAVRSEKMANIAHALSPKRAFSAMTGKASQAKDAIKPKEALSATGEKLSSVGNALNPKRLNLKQVFSSTGEKLSSVGHALSPKRAFNKIFKRGSNEAQQTASAQTNGPEVIIDATNSKKPRVILLTAKQNEQRNQILTQSSTKIAPATAKKLGLKLVEKDGKTVAESWNVSIRVTDGNEKRVLGKANAKARAAKFAAEVARAEAEGRHVYRMHNFPANPNQEAIIAGQIAEIDRIAAGADQNQN